MNPEHHPTKTRDKRGSAFPEEPGEGFTLHFGLLILGILLGGLIWFFGWMKGFLYFLGVFIALMVFGWILDFFERGR